MAQCCYRAKRVCLFSPSINLSSSEEYCIIGPVNLCSVSGHGGFSTGFDDDGTRGVQGREWLYRSRDELPCARLVYPPSC